MCWDSKKAEKYCIMYNIFQKKRFTFFLPHEGGKDWFESHQNKNKNGRSHDAMEKI